MSQPASIRVLAIEDDPEQQIAVGGYLARPGFAFEVRFASTLSEALDNPELTTFDVILLDLNLPDSAGFATLDALRARIATPIVILTAIANPDLAQQIIQHGAQDYVAKDSYAPRLLARSLYYAAERKRLQDEVARAREEASLLREQHALSDVGRSRLTVTAELLGENPLRVTAPKRFAECVAMFCDITHHALEAQTYQAAKDDPRGALLRLADELGRLRAGPQDLVDMYREATSPGVGDDSNGETLWREEARLMLIGLLGHVLSFYRVHAIVERTPPSEIA